MHHARKSICLVFALTCLLWAGVALAGDAPAPLAAEAEDTATAPAPEVDGALFTPAEPAAEEAPVWLRYGFEEMYCEHTCEPCSSDGDCQHLSYAGVFLTCSRTSC